MKENLLTFLSVLNCVILGGSLILQVRNERINEASRERSKEIARQEIASNESAIKAAKQEFLSSSITYYLECERENLNKLDCEAMFPEGAKAVREAEVSK
jgi:hypothetical protein